MLLIPQSTVIISLAFVWFWEWLELLSWGHGLLLFWCLECNNQHLRQGGSMCWLARMLRLLHLHQSLQNHNFFLSLMACDMRSTTRGISVNASGEASVQCFSGSRNSFAFAKLLYSCWLSREKISSLLQYCFISSGILTARIVNPFLWPLCPMFAIIPVLIMHKFCVK